MITKSNYNPLIYKHETIDRSHAQLQIHLSKDWQLSAYLAVLVINILELFLYRDEPLAKKTEDSYQAYH